MSGVTFHCTYVSNGQTFVQTGEYVGHKSKSDKWGVFQVGRFKGAVAPHCCASFNSPKRLMLPVSDEFYVWCVCHMFHDTCISCAVMSVVVNHLSNDNLLCGAVLLLRVRTHHSIEATITDVEIAICCEKNYAGKIPDVVVWTNWIFNAISCASRDLDLVQNNERLNSRWWRLSSLLNRLFIKAKLIHIRNHRVQLGTDRVSTNE